MVRGHRHVAACIGIAAALFVLSGVTVAAAQDAQGVGRTHPVEPVTSPSHSEVFKEILPDLWRFLSADTAVVLGAALPSAFVVHAWDDAMEQEIVTNVAFNNALEPGNRYGAFAYMLGGTYAVYGLGRLSGNAHLAVVGADLFRSQLVTQAWAQALKFTVLRERPDGSNNQSFPSGHSAGGFALAAVLTRHYGWKAAIPSFLGATYIGAARIHDNKHHLSDVVFGAALGFAGARTVTLGNGRYGAVIRPVPVRRGAAVMVTITPVTR